MPAVVLQVPVERRDELTPGDAGIVEHPGKAVEQRFFAERFPGERLRVGLFNNVRGNRRSDRE